MAKTTTKAAKCGETHGLGVFWLNGQRFVPGQMGTWQTEEGRVALFRRLTEAARDMGEGRYEVRCYHVEYGQAFSCP